MVIRSALAIAAASLATACSVPEVQYTGIDRQIVVEMKQFVERNVDVLFVIDDGPGMTYVHEGLAGGIPTFIDHLETLEGGLPDLHVGVVTTNQGTLTAPGNGGVTVPNCSTNNGQLRIGTAQITGTFLSDIKASAGTRQMNYTGSIVQAVSDMIRVGSGGCPFPQPLLAMRTALRNTTANAGFLRPDALLAVYFLTNKDDCTAHETDLFDPDSAALGPRTPFRCARFGVTCASGGTSSDEMNQIGVKSECRASLAPSKLEPVETFAEYLGTVKSVPERIIIGGAIGDPYTVRVDKGSAPTEYLVPACTFQPAAQLPQEVSPGVRLQTFFDLFPESISRTACKSDLRDEVSPFADTILRKLGTACIHAPLYDADPGTAGIQPDCVVEDVHLGDVTDIAPCPAGEGLACWRIVSDSVTCPLGANLKLDVTRPSPAMTNTVTRARCRLVESM